jgi:hypothetical protein
MPDDVVDDSAGVRIFRTIRALAVKSPELLTSNQLLKRLEEDQVLAGVLWDLAVLRRAPS